MQSVYWACLLLTAVFLILSYKFEDKIVYKLLAFATINFRNLIRLFDFEESKLVSKKGETFDYVFEGDPAGEMKVVNRDFYITMILQSTMCFILCFIGEMHT